MSMRIPVVAIVGRTNVGKSSIFNALAGKPIAVVEDLHGTTRDRNYALVDSYGFPVTLVDTGGLVGEDESEVFDAVRKQAKLAIEEADIIIAVVDGREGPQPLDEEVVDILRRTNKPVIWAINKSESPKVTESLAEFYALGIEEFVPVSAAHRRGLKELMQAIAKVLEASELRMAETPAQDAGIRIAIVGRPNVGKSSLVNRLIGKSKMITSDVAGTTRDATDSEMFFNNRKFTLIDTAGLRKKARVVSRSIEQHSNLRSVQALARCDIALLVIDGTEGLPTDQDGKIGEMIHERGRGMIIVVNKWDAVEKNNKTITEYTEQVYEMFDFARYAPVIFVSAKTGQRTPKILEEAQIIYDAASERIPGPDLANLIAKAVLANPPKAYHGQPVKFIGVEHIMVRPPTIMCVVNNTNRLPESYQRYLKNTLREHFPFPGSDIRIKFKKGTKKSMGQYGVPLRATTGKMSDYTDSEDGAEDSAVQELESE